MNPAVTFRASHLLTSQVTARVPSTTQAGRDVHHAAEAVLEALGGVFVLDPVPLAMRQYVPARDSRLRRQAGIEQSEKQQHEQKDEGILDAHQQFPNRTHEPHANLLRALA